MINFTLEPSVSFNTAEAQNWVVRWSRMHLA